MTECTYVQQADGSFFSCPVDIGKNGVAHIHRDLGKLSDYENKVCLSYVMMYDRLVML